MEGLLADPVTTVFVAMEDDHQQHDGVHPRIVDETTSFRQVTGQRQLQQQQQRLSIDHAQNVNRQSVQYLVDFINKDSNPVEVFALFSVSLSVPCDGGWQVLRDFFRTTSVSTIDLSWCKFGSTTQEALQLLAEFKTNTSVTDLRICNISNLDNVSLGSYFSDLLQSQTHLQKLDCSYNCFRDTGGIVVPLHRGLRDNRYLKEMRLNRCDLEDGGFRLIVDALVGNTVLEELDDGFNMISSEGLADVTRLVEFTRLKVMCISGNPCCTFTNDHDSFWRDFSRVLQANTSLDEFKAGDMGPSDLSTWGEIYEALCRNWALNRADSLLRALRPRRTGMMMSIGSKSGIWPRAIEQMDSVVAGASGIFLIFKSRPLMFERPLRQLRQLRAAVSRRRAASAATTAASRGEEEYHYLSDEDNKRINEEKCDNDGKRARFA